MEALDSLAAEDAFSLLETMTKLAQCNSEADLLSAVQYATRLLDFRWAAYSLALLNKNRAMPTPVKIANISFPDGWAQLYLSNCFHLIDPIYIENYQHFGLQVWEETYRKATVVPSYFRKRAEEFGLKNGYSLGAKNFRGTIGTLFSISGGSLEFNSREKLILNTLLPHIHEALLRVAEPAVLDYHFQPKPLSARETELLRLVKDGVGTANICGIMKITERTVNFHMSNILKKLDASSRAQAVAISINRGLLGQDA